MDRNPFVAGEADLKADSRPKVTFLHLLYQQSPKSMYVLECKVSHVQRCTAGRFLGTGSWQTLFECFCLSQLHVDVPLSLRLHSCAKLRLE